MILKIWYSWVRLQRKNGGFWIAIARGVKSRADIEYRLMGDLLQI
jgi:hypothetical protein